jgi:hypothetical protein
LEPFYVTEAVNALDSTGRFSEDAILEALRLSARGVVSKVLRHKMRDFVNSRIVRSIDLGFDPAAEEVARLSSEAASRSIERIKRVANDELTVEKLAEREQSWKAETEAAFGDGSWRRILPGREILRSFVASQRLSIPYEAFRNLIVSRMVDSGYQPEGMKKVINEIVTSSYSPRT